MLRSTPRGEPIEWIETFFYIPENQGAMKLAEYQRQLLDFLFKEEVVPWSTIIWSEPKKSGKSALAAAVARWWAEVEEPYNELYCCANDFEQAQGRNYTQIRRSIEMSLDPRYGASDDVAARAALWKLSGRQLTYEGNGSFIQALSGDYRGAAGGNPGMIVFSELWGYISESSRRLYGEMTTVPTRKNSFRWIETYAGWEGESTELERLWKQGLNCPPVEELSDLRDEKGDVEVRADRESGLFMFWSHTPRQYWQLGTVGARYYAEQRSSLRAAEFARFHKNEWATREGGFIEPAQWDELFRAATPLEDLLRTLPEGSHVEIVLAADASKNRDCTALIGIVLADNPDNPKMPFVDLALVRIWQPSYDEELDKVQMDLDATVGAALYELAEDKRVKIRTVAYDPYQLHSIMVTFTKRTKVDVTEIPQTERRVQTDTALLDLIRSKRLRVFSSPPLREHVLNAVAIERPRGIRLDKDATTRHIDGAVALAMASWAALHYVPGFKRRFVKV
jgi:hypothetical protein